MRKTIITENKLNNDNNKSKGAYMNMKKLITISLVLAIAAIITYTVIDNSKKRLTEEEKALLLEKTSAIFHETKERDNELYNTCIRNIESIVNSAAGQSSSGIQNVINETCSMKKFFRLAYYLATGNNEFERIISDTINRNVLSHMQNAISQSENEVLKLYDALGESRTNLNAQLLHYKQDESQLPENERLNAIFKKLVEESLKSRESIKELNIEKISVAITLAFESIFIRSTYETFKRVLTPLISRLSKTALASVSASLTDGPLPIGDFVGVLITVGGSVWVAKDLYQITKQIPNNIRAELNGSIENSRQQTIIQAKQSADKIFEEHRKYLQQIEEEIKNKINEDR